MRGAWLASSAWAHRWWLSAIEGFSEVLFPGVILTSLGLAGAWRALTRTPDPVPAALPAPGRLDDPAGARLGAAVRAPGLPRDVAGFYLLIAVLAFWLSFGPDAGLYTLFFETLPVFAFLRAPARMGLMVALAFTVLSSVVLGPWLAARRRPVAWTTALVLLAALELNGAPLRALRAAPPVPEAYHALARLPRGPVVEFPYFYRRSDFPRHAEYMLGSTVHFQPLINGYSDHIPAEWRATVVPISSFPTRESFGILGKIGARYAVFHLNGYDRRSRERLLERLQEYQRYLRPIVQQDDVWLFEIVDWPN